MKKNKKNFILLVMLCILYICLGVILSHLYPFTDLKFSDSIDIIDSITLIITIIFTVYISILFTTNQEKKRIEREIFVEITNKMEIFINDLFEMVKNKNLQLNELQFTLKQFGVYKTKTIELMKTHKIENDIITDDISTKYIELRNLMTKYPNPSQDIIVENGRYIYNLIREKEIIEKLNDIQFCLYQFKMQ